MRIRVLLAFVFVMCLPLLGGCEGANVLGRAFIDSAVDSTSELDQEYGSNTFRHATKKRIRCSPCGGDGYVNEDEATTSNPIGRCKVCDGKGYMYEF